MPGLYHPLARSHRSRTDAHRPSWRWVLPAAFPPFSEAADGWCSALRDDRLRLLRQVTARELDECLVLQTDSSGTLGWGAVNPELREALHGLLTDQQRSWAIDAQELLPVVALCKRYGPTWGGRTVAFSTDNASNAYNLNAGKAASPNTRRLLSTIYACADTYRFHALGLWLPREYNTLCDALSKCATFSHACSVAGSRGLSCYAVSVEQDTVGTISVGSSPKAGPPGPSA